MTTLPIDELLPSLGRIHSRATVTFEMVVEREDSNYTPFNYRLSWCKQRELGTYMWVADYVPLLSEFGGIPNAKKMQVGDKWHYRVKATLFGDKDYWGEYRGDMEIHSARCFKKYKRIED